MPLKFEVRVEKSEETWYLDEFVVKMSTTVEGQRYHVVEHFPIFNHIIGSDKRSVYIRDLPQFEHICNHLRERLVSYIASQGEQRLYLEA